MRRILSKVWSTALLFSTFLTMAAYQNCGSQSSQQQYVTTHQLTGVSISGTVQKSNLDGCQYLISSVDSSTGKVQQFIPYQMDPNLLVDGNVVSVNGTIITDLVTDCMAGPILQVEQATLVSSQ